jgi:hypothetical protein
MSYKFIIDTNVLCEESANQLIKGGIISACNSGRFSFYATPILITESTNFVTKGKIPLRAIKPLKLLTELKWQRLFNEPGGPDGIYTGELEGKSRTEYLFTDYQPVKQKLAFISNGGQFTDEAKREMSAYLTQRTAEKVKNHESYKLIRADLIKKLQENKSLSRKDSKFDPVLKLRFEPTVIEKIKTSINSNVPKDKLIECWTKHKERCPYFNKVIEGWLFTAWYFMAVEPEPKIDINASEDIEHLVYLLGLDGIVSNEKGFIKAACETLFPNKNFLTVEQFVKRLRV